MIRECLNNQQSEQCLLAERAFLRTLEGGCSIPAFGHAVIEKDSLRLHAGLANLDGSWLLTKAMTGELANPEQLGFELGNFILNNGGSEVLKEIKSLQNGS